MQNAARTLSVGGEKERVRNMVRMWTSGIADGFIGRQCFQYYRIALEKYRVLLKSNTKWIPYCTDSRRYH